MTSGKSSGAGSAGELLRLEHVSKSFDSVGDGAKVNVLSDVEREIDRGETVAIVGPSGSGKSTLLNIIGTLDHPTSGKVLLDRRDLSSLEEDELAGVRNRQMGFVFQAHHLLPQCTVLENGLVPVLAQSDSKAREQAVVRGRSLLDRVGLGHPLDDRPARRSEWGRSGESR